MRICAFSDIHAILATWNAVYKHMQQHHSHGYWCLGDIVGRGYNAIGVAQALMGVYAIQEDDEDTRHHNRAWVRGNHDQNIFNREIMKVGGMFIHKDMRMNNRDVALDAQNLDHLVTRPQLLSWLSQMPHYALNVLDGFFAGVHVIHGRFIYKDDKIHADDCIWQGCKTDDHLREQVAHLAQYTHQTPRIILNAHTHHPSIGVYHADTGNITRVAQKDLFSPHTFELQPHQTLHINTGSVSFPRDVEPHCAMYVLLEFMPPHTVSVHFQPVPINLAELNIPNTYDDHYTGELNRLCSV